MTGQPANRPTGQPANRPTGQPANRPTGQPANRPTGQPANRPDRCLAGARKPALSAGSPSRPEPRSGRSRARRFRLLPVLALLVGALSLFAAVPAQAQVPTNTCVKTGLYPATGAVVAARGTPMIALRARNPDDRTYLDWQFQIKAADDAWPTRGSTFYVPPGSVYDTDTNFAHPCGGGIVVAGLTSGASYDVRFYLLDTSNQPLSGSTTPIRVTVPTIPAPAAPTSLTVTPGDGKLDLSWTASPGAASYHVDYTTSVSVAAGAAASGSDETAAWVRTGTVTTASHTISNLTNLQRYRVRVRAVNAAGQSPWKHAAGAPEGLLLTGLAYTESGHADGPYAALELEPGFEPRVAGYTAAVPHTVTHVKVRARVSAASYTLSVGKRGATASTLTSGVTSAAIALDPGVNVIEVKAAATTMGANQTTWTVTVTRHAHEVPGAPRDLTVTAGAGAGELALAWRVNAGWVTGFLRGYDVHYTSATRAEAPDGAAASGSDPAAAWVAVSRSGIATTQTISGLTAGTTYRVRVRAENGNGKGFWAQATGTPREAAQPPAAPTGLRVTAGDAQLALAWTAPSGTVTGYDVHYTSALAGTVANDAAASGNDPAAAWVAVSRSGTAASQTISGLDNGTDYRVRVRAVNTGGNGAWVHGAGTPRGAGTTPTVRLSASPNPVTEGSSVTVTATLSGALSSSVTIPVTIIDNSAEPEDHGTLTSIAIASGATSGTGRITTNQDTDEADETFTVALGALPSEVTAGTPSSVQIRITDDDRVVVVTLSSNANLSGLTGATSTDGTTFGGTLTLTPSTFSAAATSYAATVADTITHVKLTPTVQDTGKASVAVDGTTVTSGSPSAAIALDEGANAITVRVTAEDGTTKDYAVTVTRQAAALSSDASLSGLTGATSTDGTTFGGTLTLTPSAFSATTTSYAATVADTITHVKLTPTVQDTGKASVAVDGTTVTSGTASAAIALSEGANTITVRVTAEDGTTKDYTVTVTRQAAALSSNANLSGLTASSNTRASGTFAALALTPSTFSAATTSYTATVANTITHLKLTPTVQDTGKATVAVDGTTVSSGTASAAIALDEGANAITVRVTAEDGTTKDYAVTITRQAAALSSNANLSGLTGATSTDGATFGGTLALTPSAFSAATTSYAATVADTITHVKLTPTVQDTDKASVAVNGSTVTSGSSSAAIALDEGANAITVRVTAEDGTTKDYTVTVTRQAATLSSNANLSGLTASSNTSASGTFAALALTPSTFSAATTSYAATVANTITHLKLTPTVQDTGKASVAVDGTTVTSGTASAAIALGEGANTITVRVTAEDGTTKDYTVTVTRQAAALSSNANLSGLTGATSTDGTTFGGTLTLTPSTFSATTTSYTANVANTITHVKLTPTVQDTGKASVAVNGTTVSSGSASAAIALDEGANAITVRVTAEDGTTKDYTVTVTRQAATQSSDASPERAAGLGRDADALLFGGDDELRGGGGACGGTRETDADGEPRRGDGNGERRGGGERLGERLDFPECG